MSKEPTGERARANYLIRKNGTADEQDQWSAWGLPWPFDREEYEARRARA